MSVFRTRQKHLSRQFCQETPIMATSKAYLYCNNKYLLRKWPQKGIRDQINLSEKLIWLVFSSFHHMSIFWCSTMRNSKWPKNKKNGIPFSIVRSSYNLDQNYALCFYLCEYMSVKAFTMAIGDNEEEEGLLQINIWFCHELFFTANGHTEVLILKYPCECTYICGWMCWCPDWLNHPASSEGNGKAMVMQSVLIVGKRSSFRINKIAPNNPSRQCCFLWIRKV